MPRAHPSPARPHTRTHASGTHPYTQGSWSDPINGVVGETMETEKLRVKDPNGFPTAIVSHVDLRKGGLCDGPPSLPQFSPHNAEIRT